MLMTFLIFSEIRHRFLPMVQFPDRTKIYKIFLTHLEDVTYLKKFAVSHFCFVSL